MSTMAQRIKEKRLEYHLTMEELGQKLGVQKSAVNKWEKNQVENIKRSTIAKMAEIFQCRPSWLMGYDAETNVTVTYESPGKEPLKLLVDRDKPIIGQSRLRAELYQAALEVSPANLEVAIKLLKSLT